MRMDQIDFFFPRNQTHDLKLYFGMTSLEL